MAYNILATEIPNDWLDTYKKILVVFSEYGLEAIKDCKATCDKRNSKIVDCYNIFNSAVAANVIGQTKKATLIYNYVKSQMDIYYPNIVI